MFTICARIDSKKSDGNFGSNAVGIIVTAENLELKSPEEIATKADELFRLAREAVERQAGGGASGRAPTPQPAPSNGNGSNGHTAAASGNGHGNGTGNGGRTYGRPPQGSEPTVKQRSLLRSIAKRRNLGAETIREICQRVVGKDPKDFTKVDMIKLLDHLLQKQEAA